MQERLLDSKNKLNATEVEIGKFIEEASKMDKQIQSQIKKNEKLLSKIQEEKQFITAEKESMRELELKIKRDHERLDAHEKRVKESLNSMNYAG